MPGWTERRGHTATALPDERVLVAGGTADERGYYGITAIPDLHIFEGSSVGLAPAGMLTEGRMQHTATALLDGRVLIVGGVGNELEGDEDWLYAPALASAEIWEPE